MSIEQQQGKYQKKKCTHPAAGLYWHAITRTRHTLAKQMGTSVLMIEKHYSHLKVVQAIDQLRREESRQLIAAGGVMDAADTQPQKS